MNKQDKIEKEPNQNKYMMTWYKEAHLAGNSKSYNQLACI
jgi:hypothetical protein